MSLFGGGVSTWLLHTYRKLRFVIIVGFVLGLVLWYFNSVLFYDVVDGSIETVIYTGNMVKEFVNGF
tara:strand:+ start:349 stop:549 length:201 start_codon:yes stop_codon:yes gene_type:complete